MSIRCCFRFEVCTLHGHNKQIFEFKIYIIDKYMDTNIRINHKRGALQTALSNRR